MGCRTLLKNSVQKIRVNALSFPIAFHNWWLPSNFLFIWNNRSNYSLEQSNFSDTSQDSGHVNQEHGKSSICMLSETTLIDWSVLLFNITFWKLLVSALPLTLVTTFLLTNLIWRRLFHSYMNSHTTEMHNHTSGHLFFLIREAQFTSVLEKLSHSYSRTASRIWNFRKYLQQ